MKAKGENNSTFIEIVELYEAYIGRAKIKVKGEHTWEKEA